jgi:polyhydroxybutyrate depolymerase
MNMDSWWSIPMDWNAVGLMGDHKRIDDAKFVTALSDRLEREYKVDLARIYATGMSNGGFMSGRWLASCPTELRP